uniref:Putative UBP1-associated protein 2A-like n=1 Tax=Davidia involucrata TaxID=16924 RepID=A0A5B7A4L6_DAVIN
MGKKRKAAPPEVEVKQKPKVVEHDTSEEDESDPEEVEEEEEDESEEEEEEEDEEEEEENEVGSERESLRKLIEPFGKDQIIEFLIQAALNDCSIINRIKQFAESDPGHRKIFVYNLGWETTTEQVLSVFKQYGEIEECTVVGNKVTGRTKGYGFVIFKTRDGALNALKQPQKMIGDRTTSCQLASIGSVPSPVPDSSGRKIYVGNVGPLVNPDMLRSFFAKFGEIEEGPIGHNPVTGKLKGFAIFIYKTAEGCKKALEEPIKVFEGCQLECRRAVKDLRIKKNKKGFFGASSGAASIQQTDINTPTNGVGVNPVIFSRNVNPAAVPMGQSPGIGLANPVLAPALHQPGLAPALHRPGLAPALHPPGLAPALHQPGLVPALHQPGLPPSVANGLTPVGATPSLRFNGNYSINSISRSVIGSYGSQAALQGLGAYQNTQLGHSSAGATEAAAVRSQSGFGSMGTTFPSYFGR